MQKQKFILLQKVEDLTNWLFPIVDKFPRTEKFALCTQIKNSVYTILRCIIQSQKSRNKLQGLYAADIELNMLRFLIRHAHARRYLNTKKYKHANELLIEIGKILGGTIKSLQGNRL